MTGYGKGTATADGIEISVELKSVNNRFLEINTRMGKSYLCCEEAIRAVISKNIARGNIDVYFTLTNSCAQSDICVDFDAIKNYIDLANQAQNLTGIKNDLCFSHLMRMPDIIKNEQKQLDTQLLTQLSKDAAMLAVAELNNMRSSEGQGIRNDLILHLGAIKEGVAAAAQRMPEMLEATKQRLKERIKEHLEGVELDETRLVNEVAFYADRADVNEEIQRLNSHISQFESTLDSGEPQGRRLDFLSQEINREINTLGSKPNDILITNLVIEMKNSLEKIKEQIRNIE